MCLDCLSLKTLNFEVVQTNSGKISQILTFIKISAQVINIFSEIWQNKK
jgi:hypothetical protein